MFNLNVTFSTTVRILILAAFIVATIQFPASAGKQDFVFVNKSGKIVTELRFNPSTGGGMESNVLSSAIYNGESRNIYVNGFSDADCYWDFKVITSDGTVWTWYEIDLLSVDKITVDENGTIHYD